MDFTHTELPIETEFPKLVRDNIPQMIRENDHVDPKIEVAEDDTKFLQYILKKIIEESIELSEFGGDIEDLKKELADVVELIHVLAQLENINLKEVDAIRDIKREKNGGFDKRYILISK